MELPLTSLRDGESGIISKIAGSRHNLGPHRFRWGFQKRLEAMGLTPGTKITVIQSAPFQGPVELHVRGARLAIGRKMAERIFVRVER